MNALQTLNLLRRLRDWPKPQRPFGHIIILIALREAGTRGLRSGQLSIHLGRPGGNNAGPFLEQLEKSGLVLRHLSPERRSTCYWTLSPLGQNHIQELLTADPGLVPEPA